MKAHTFIENDDASPKGSQEAEEFVEQPLPPINVSASMAARAYFNSAETIKSSLKNLDLVLKTQILYFELSSAIFWVSILEQILMLFTFCIWLLGVQSMGYLWMHIWHMPRSVVGGILVFRMPNTHDMISSI